MTIAEHIDAILKERKLSRRKLAIIAGIPTSTLQSAMQRNGSISVEMLIKIASALGIDPLKLFRDAVEAVYSTEKEEAK